MSQRKHLPSIHVPHHKNTAACETVTMPIPDEVSISMSQNIGAPCQPLVEKGDYVKVGQRIGDVQAFVSAPIFSSVSGTVKSIDKVRGSMGGFETHIVIETDKKFKVEIAAPGLTKEDFKIELNSENQLVVCLEHCDEKGDKGGECCGEEDCTKGEKHHYLRREFSYTSFRQIFNLPDSVDKEKITAKMSHGVLKIKLPKREGGEKLPELKTIAIE